MVMIAGTSWGKILKSTNGGVSWTEQHSEPGENIEDICFADAITAIAVSAHGKVYRSTDAGETWSVTQIGQREYFHIHFINATTGWISGSDGYMLRTVDGGQTWTEHFIRTHQPQQCVYFKDTLNGFVAGTGGMLLRTKSGGILSVHGEEDARVAAALSCRIYPNPSGNETTASYFLPQDCIVTAAVFDIQGQRVSSAFEGYKHRSQHTDAIHTGDLHPGIYFLRLTAGNLSVTQKLVRADCD